MFSREALEDLLSRAANSEHVKGITVLAHSMGSYLAMELCGRAPSVMAACRRRSVT